MNSIHPQLAGVEAAERSTSPAYSENQDDESLHGVDDAILEDNKEGLIDNPLLHHRPGQADDLARQFARDYGFSHLQDLFVKGGRVMRDPEAWQTVPGLTPEEREALRSDPTSGFWRQPKQLRVTVITLCLAAIVQGWNQTGSNGANLNWPDEFKIHPSPPHHVPRDRWIFAIVNASTYLSASVIGCWLSDPLNEYFFGRRAAIFISGIFVLASVIGGACTRNWQQLLGCRVLLGIGMGTKASSINMIVQLPVPVYAAEVAPSHIRGSLVMNWQLFDALGIFCGFTANLAVSQLGPLAWRFQTASAFLPTIMMLTLIFVCPESPRFYMKRGAKYYGEAYKSLLHLRGLPLLAAKELFYCHLQIELEKKLLSPKSHDAEQRPNARKGPRESHANDQPGLRSRKARNVDHGGTPAEVYRSPSVANEESTETSNDGASADEGNRSKILTLKLRSRRHSVRSKNNRMHLWHGIIAPKNRSINYWQKLGQLFTKGRIRRATIAAGVCMISQQLCGVNVLAFYSSTLFRDAKAPGINALWLSWGIGFVNFVFGLPAYWLIDRYGRRFLLLITIPGLALSMLAAAFSFNISEEQQKAHTGVISLFWFIFMAIYSLGMGPVPFSLSAEVFPLENRVVGMSFAVFLNFLGAGILTLVVPPLTDVKHTKILSVFAALNVVAFILVFFFVRETAGATLSRTPGNLNPMSLEELNYIFGVRNFEHIEYQVKTVVPWAFNRYIRRMNPPECPEHPKKLYKWAWEVEKSRKEKQQQQEAQALQIEEEHEANEEEVEEIERKP